MNESLKIGLGIILGFLLLGLLFYLTFSGTGDDAGKKLLETQNIEIRRDSKNNHTVLIKESPEIAKQEVFIWLQEKQGLELTEICSKVLFFKFGDNVTKNETQNFDPQFEACKL